MPAARRVHAALPGTPHYTVLTPRQGRSWSRAIQFNRVQMSDDNVETASTAISVAGVCKRWGDTAAVDDVTFTASGGQFTVLLGPSGCGKSTTLRLIAGLESVSSGEIRLGDRDITSLAPARRELSMVFQSYALFPHLSVAENILFGLKVRRVEKSDAGAADLIGSPTCWDCRACCTGDPVSYPADSSSVWPWDARSSPRSRFA